MTGIQEFNETLRKIKYDADAREKFCFKYYNLLKIHVSLKYGDFPDWEDVVQDAIKKLIETDWTSYPYIEKPVGWLYTITDNLTKDRFKKSNRICEFNDNTYSTFSIESVDIRNDVREAMKHLKRKEQYILYAHYWLGKELFVIAEEINMQYSAVRAAISRARKALKKFL